MRVLRESDVLHRFSGGCYHTHVKCWLTCLVAAVAVSALAEGETAPTAAELDRRRLELETLKARFEAERARYEADKARFEAERAKTEASTTPHDPFAGRLHMARKPVRLYRRGQIAGDLPPLTVVLAAPSADEGWLTVQHNGENYDAPAESFAREQDLLGEARRTETTALQDLEKRESELQDMRARRDRLEAQIIQLESQLRRIVVATYSTVSIRMTNAEGRAVVVSESAGRNSLADWRRELRKASRQIELAQQDVYLLREHWERSRQVRERLEGAFTAFRNERTP